ncbi:MAG TPA: GlsB/YeaQ/YmgE family stress response membrane protein [Rudaea sp.]|nr:GlsB/YeaQ/YmgE family stress response membrane protein [Rudaea sp.]
MFHLLWSIIVGFIVGLIAHFFVPVGHLGFLWTTVVGIVGSLIGGLLGGLIKKPASGSLFHPAGFLMSIVGAVVLLLIIKYTGFQI